MTTRSIGSRTGATASSTAEMAPGHGSPCNAGAGATSRVHAMDIGGAVGELAAGGVSTGAGDTASVGEGFGVVVQAATISAAPIAKRTARAAVRNPVTGSGARDAMH